MFSGKILRVTERTVDFSPVLVATFAVEQGWKGVRRPQIDVLTPKGSAACGFDFKPGQRYLLYAYDIPDKSPERATGARLRTDICRRTRPRESDLATEDVQKLGPPEYVPR